MLVLPEGLKHIAVIMDGNGRWANARGYARTRGHKEGIKSVRAVTTACADAGLGWLTLYSMSVENFVKRPRAEVEFLLILLKRFVVQERRTIMENNIRFRTIGRVHEYPAGVRDELQRLTDLSARNSGMVLCLALNYGGRTEIVDAARRMAEQVRAGTLDPADIDEQAIADRLYDPTMPEPDLLVRTAGELRISNFLLWQVSYSEIYVTDTYWPDFGTKELETALASYSSRKRKFGGLVHNLNA
jgi:undecaprenyl diphosphate synthase